VPACVLALVAGPRCRPMRQPQRPVPVRM
jgi:hypothetical protein